MHVAEAGADRGGDPIVLLHGNPDTHAVWRGVVAHLAGRHRCIAPDLPGFGRSRAPATFDVTLEGVGGFVEHALDALGLAKVHLVIHDVGGTYGNAFVSQHRERVRSLTIFNTNFSPDYAWHFWARVWRAPVLGEIAMAVANRWLFVTEARKGSPGMTVEMAEEAWRWFSQPETRKMVLRFYREHDPEKLAGWDERLRAATAEIPSQVLWGDLDPFLPARTAERFGAGEVHHYADGGHWVMLDRPDDAAAKIAALVARTT